MTSTATVVLLVSCVGVSLAFNPTILISGLLEFPDTQTYTPGGIIGARTANNLAYGINQKIGAAAVSLGPGTGQAIFTGGEVPLADGVSASAETQIYNANFLQSTPGPTMLQARYSHGISIDGHGIVTVCGGSQFGRKINSLVLNALQNTQFVTYIRQICSCEQLDTKNLSAGWTLVASLPHPVSELALTETPVGMIAFGGIDSENNTLDYVWAYDPNMNSEDGLKGVWRHRSSMPMTLRGFGAVQFPNTELTLVCGGFKSATETTPENQCYTYDPAGEGTWLTTGQMKYKRAFFSLAPWSAVGSGPKVYAVGGTDGNGALGVVDGFTDADGDGYELRTSLITRVQQAATVGIL